MPFRFLHFSVEDTCSTQRVGTDAMLLGSWARPGESAHILDIGTGCGVLALMMAQKSTGIIEAIDIDAASVTEASANFQTSPWSSRLSASCTELQAFTGMPNGYDYIISNPPFFTSALLSPDKRRSYARHDVRLPMQELIRAVDTLLASEGRFALILPAGTSAPFTAEILRSGFFLHRKTAVQSKPDSLPKRTLMEFGRKPPPVLSENVLIILNKNNGLSSKYLTLTAEFHNF